MTHLKRLLWFNMVTDADAAIQGFTTAWLNAAAPFCDAIDVLTMFKGRLALADNITVYSVGKDKGYSEPRRALEFYRTLNKLLRHNHYDACFIHMIQLFAVMGAPLIKPRGIPMTLWYAHKSTPLTLKLAEKWVDQVVTASPESFRLPTSKVRIVGHGIDTDHFIPGPPRAAAAFNLLSVSRIAPIKRLEIMISAVKTLHEQGFTSLRLRLVGSVYPQDEAYAAGLRRLIHDAGLDHAISLPGPIRHADVLAEYHQADAVLNMSATGSVDKAVLEGMACALPVITANEAFQTMLAPWADTLLVPPDSPEQLAARLKTLLTMPAPQRAALGAALRAIVIESHSLAHLMPLLISSLNPNLE